MGNQLFVSHNSDDEDLITNLSKCISRMSYKMYIASFEGISGSVYEDRVSFGRILKNEILNSEALIFHMSGGAQDHTLAWIAWELGVASEAGKPIIVIEEEQSSYDMPIPLLQEYILFDVEKRDSLRELRDCLIDILDDPNPSTDELAKCDHSLRKDIDPCMQSFRPWMNAQSSIIQCPSCRRNLLSTSSETTHETHQIDH
ncbi:MAG: hypothetical protein ABEI86_14625 [Halobacteriaceae archaeon]